MSHIGRRPIVERIALGDDQPDSASREYQLLRGAFPVSRQPGEPFDIGSIGRSQQGCQVSFCALTPLAWLIALGALLISPKSRRRNRLGAMSGPALLPGGKYLYVEAIKRA